MRHNLKHFCNKFRNVTMFSIISKNAKTACIHVVLLMLAFWLLPQTAAASAGVRMSLSTCATSGVGGVLSPAGRLAALSVGEEKRTAVDPEDMDPEGDMDTLAGDLVMANVSVAMNVRLEPSESSEKVGYLYKDCGGRIIEQRDGWTRLQSGDLVGWANDDYLLFDKEAQALAAEVGVQLVSSKEDALAIREAPDEDSDTVGIITTSGIVDMISDEGDGWISVSYDDRVCYVQSEYVTIDFRIDAGETMEVIRKREAEEKARKEAAEARKAKLREAQSAVDADTDETRLLAALIQCEAGNQPYEGKVGVGAVVLNRVRSAAYANTIYSVIYASGQFTPARNGSLAARYNGSISDSCMQAAREVLAGATTVGTATHFRRVGSHEGGIVIGDHVFW